MRAVTSVPRCETGFIIQRFYGHCYSKTKCEHASIKKQFGRHSNDHYYKFTNLKGKPGNSVFTTTNRDYGYKLSVKQQYCTNWFKKISLNHLKDLTIREVTHSLITMDHMKDQTLTGGSCS